jgi:Ca2+-binding RTX toxin-like protein
MFVPSHITDTWINFSQPKAINSLSYQFSLDSIPSNSCYYYWAYQSALSDGQVWYVGFQNNGNLNGSITSPLVNFSVWGATGGKSGTNGIAQNFSNEGTGFRTATPYNFKAGDIYIITIKQLSNNLNCYVQDKKTGVSTFVGTVTLDTNQNLTSNAGCLFNEVYMPVESASDIFPVSALWNNFQINNSIISNLTNITDPPFHDSINITNNVDYATIVTNKGITQFTGGDGNHIVNLTSDNSVVYLGNGPDIINWVTGNNDSVDGGTGNDSLNTFNNFSSYKFSNLNLGKSTVTLTSIATNKSINLTSIENIVFADKTIPFSQIVIPNAVPTGAATLKGLSTWGTTLSITSTIKDADGIGKLSYTWQNDKATLSTSATYTLADSDIGKQVWAVVSYTDKKGNLEEVKSNVINVTVSDKSSTVNDVLTGTEGVNKLNGLAGNDTLIGGLGKDSLTGGVGADVFKFNSANDSSALPKQADTITDFKHAQGDKIDLSAINANSVLPSDQAFALINTTTFSADATGQLRFDAKTSTLYGSTNADVAPEFAIVLSGVKTLVAEDLIL